MSNIKNEVPQFGAFLVGKLLGFKQVSGTSRATNNPYTMHYMGIELPVENGFPGETVTVDVQCSTDVMNAGLQARVNPMIGKTVSAAVYVRAYATRGGAGWSYNLTNNLQAVSLHEVKKEIKAA